MKLLQIMKPGQAVWREGPRPQPGEGEALVKVLSAPDPGGPIEAGAFSHPHVSIKPIRRGGGAVADEKGDQGSLSALG
jgi:hypothetical protein